MTESPMMMAALQYAARGWLIFPCYPGQKVPIIKHGVRGASNNEATIRAWWSRWPSANIGLACGKESGVCVIDVDRDDEKGIDGWKSLEQFPSIPETVSQHSPRGGGHFFFKTDNPPKNKNSFRPGIDIRSGGYYVILAPSIHPNGRAYEWIEGHGPGEIELAEFPDWARPELEKRVAPWDKARTPVLPVVSKTPVIERASLYLAECEPAIQSLAGHDKLLWAANAMVNGFDLDDGTALSLLWGEYNPRCSPPWDRSNPAEVKEFERKVTEARKTCTKPKGWLLQEYGLNNDAASLEYGARLVAGLLEGEERKREIPLPQIIMPSAMAKATTQAGEWPEFLMNPTGYVGDLTKWINETARCPQPKFALISSIVAAGALFGGKIRDKSNQRTNLYAMGVGPSSSGKDHPFKCIAELFDIAGAGDLIGGGSVTSDSAIELSLATYPVKLFCIDEAGDFLTGIKQAASGSSAHLATIKPTFKILWSSANRVYKGKQKADQEIRVIREPHVSMWALTTPRRFYSGISPSDIEDGFVPRLIVAISNVRNPYREIDYTPPPKHIVDVTAAWVARQVPGDESLGDILSASRKNQIVIDAHPGAVQVFSEFARHCERILADGDERRDDMAPIWGKALENAKRIALILAAGDRFDATDITEHHALYACTLIKQTICDLIEAIHPQMADTPWELERKRILSILTEAGVEGVSRNEFTRRTQFIRDRKTRENHLADLIEGGQIVSGVKKTKTFPAKWLWVHPYGLGGDNDE